MGSHTIPPARDAASVMVALRRIVRFLRIADRETEASHGLSAAQLFVLHSLAETPAGSLGELASRTLTDQSSVSTVVTRLVARRLVARAPSPHDRRRTELRLTPAGRQLVVRAPKLPQTQIVEAVRAMPPPRRAQLVRSLDGLVAAIGAKALEPRMLFEDESARPARSSRRARR